MSSSRHTKTCLTPSSSPIASMQEKEVSFQDIEFFEFNVILGDNPACSAGAPVALGNKLKRRTVYNLDFYEDFVRPLSDRPPNKGKCILSVTERANLLLDNGFSIMEIANATMAVEQVQKERLETFRNVRRDDFGLMVDSLARWIFTSAKEPTIITGTDVRNMLSSKSKKKRSVSAKMA
ncbi:hypothetical protein IV203_037680 [Nitzschia inconspicua]|uniref:Uncharacterized protein n=1 Tax=Nitzschia inconspicua TaxID=303405 RepID=A0A9K3LLE7_9STRA|nr:hypothetical protein IV203_037680 [Nitzschia inconspicua]